MNFRLTFSLIERNIFICYPFLPSSPSFPSNEITYNDRYVMGSVGYGSRQGKGNDIVSLKHTVTSCRSWYVVLPAKKGTRSWYYTQTLVGAHEYAFCRSTQRDSSQFWIEKEHLYWSEKGAAGNFEITCIRTLSKATDSSEKSMSSTTSHWITERLKDLEATRFKKLLKGSNDDLFSQLLKVVQHQYWPQ